MFTSRAEYRILLRQNTADIRLTPKAHKIGLASNERNSRVQDKSEAIQRLRRFIEKQSVSPDEVNPILRKNGTPDLKQKVKLGSLLLRPQLKLTELSQAVSSLSQYINKLNTSLQTEIMEEVEIQLKYGGYIEKEQELANKLNRLDNLNLSADLNYHEIISLSSEATEKLSKLRPSTLGQASRIAGVSPSDISVLTVYLGR